MKKHAIIHRSILYLVLSSIIGSGLLIMLILTQGRAPNYSVSDGYSYSKTAPNYINESASSVQLIDSLSLPTKSVEDMAQWAAMVVTRSMTINFYQYRVQYKNLMQFYTDSGWKGFSSAMDDLATEIIKKKLSVTAVLTGVPLLVREGLLPDGAYAWKFQMPILVSYESPSETVTQKQVVSVVVKRVPVNEKTGLRGIAVDSFVSST